MIKLWMMVPLCVLVCCLTSSARAAEILTPKPPQTPRINGPRVYGERPGRPFLFTIPATGAEPITYLAEGLPEGLVLDARLGRITGTVAKEGEYRAKLTAGNALGKDSKILAIKIGDQICLTPPMGWNSWNCFAGAVTQEKVRAQAEAMAKSGLVKHGWTYINIDDTWQGARGGKYNALQGNDKFPDMKKLCDEIHALGLKAGIYSTPWVTSYAGYAGGSAENPEGTWTKHQGAKEQARTHWARMNKNLPDFPHSGDNTPWVAKKRLQIIQLTLDTPMLKEKFDPKDPRAALLEQWPTSDGKPWVKAE